MSRFTESAARVAKRLHDTGAGHIEFVKDLLNDAKDEIVTEYPNLNFLEDTVSLAIVANKHNYPLSSLPPAGVAWKVNKIRTVRIPAQWDLPLEYLDPDTFDIYLPEPSKDKGTPVCWTVWDNELLLGPMPDSAFTGSIKVYRDIPDFDDTNGTPPWPKQFDKHWEHYAEYIGHLFNDEDRLADKAFFRFDRGLRKFRSGDQVQHVTQIKLGSSAGPMGAIYRGPGYPRTFPRPYGGP